MHRQIFIVLLSPLIFCVAASSTLMSVQSWWSDDYFKFWLGMGWLAAWPDYAFDPNAWRIPGGLRGIIKGGGAQKLQLQMWIVASGIIGFLIVVILYRAAGNMSEKKLFGKAKWQSFSGARKAGIKFSRKPPGDAVALGIYYLFGFIRLYASFPGQSHLTLTATTGAGKGVGCVVPNALNWAGPLFVFSVKRDVLEYVAAERERKGDRVYVFDVTEPMGRTHRWSGFGDARVYGDGGSKEDWRNDKSTEYNADLYDDIQRAMFTLIPETRANNPYWDNAARMVATAIGVMLAETPGKSLSVGEILATIERNDYEQYLRDLIFKAEKSGQPFPQGAVYTILSWLNNKAEEAAAAVRQNIITAFALWHSPRIDAATVTSDFNLKNIRSQQVSIFVCAQPSDISRLRPIYTLLFTQFVEANTRVEFGDDPTHRPVRTLCILDERWALGKMKSVDQASAFIRSYGIRVLTVLQTRKSLNEAIGEDSASMIYDNSDVQIIYGGCDEETAEAISKRLGTLTFEDKSLSKPRFNLLPWSKQNENIHARERRLMLPQEVSGLDSSQLIVLMKGKPALKLKKIIWYKDSFFRKMAGSAPPMPQLAVKVRRERVSVD